MEALLKNIDNTEKDVLSKAQIMLKIDTESEPCEHPWLKYAGMFANDSDWELFQESLRQYRRETDFDTVGL